MKLTHSRCYKPDSVVGHRSRAAVTKKQTVWDINEPMPGTAPQRQRINRKSMSQQLREERERLFGCELVVDNVREFVVKHGVKRASEILRERETIISAVYRTQYVPRETYRRMNERIKALNAGGNNDNQA
ncbi:MAG: hypothetical protein JNL32_07690 [Candidatus Kapabacteria bacterium]|nr:hypothetical protein [Candidatus Kapabacteria bacterium]